MQKNNARRIKLRSIDFGTVAFRKLKKIKFSFAPRITVIAGHNGVGKSTILGLVASTSGLVTSEHRSYFNKQFNTKLDEIIFIDYANEFQQSKADDELPRPVIAYEINNGELLSKRSALSDRKQQAKARLVPRNAPLKEFVSNDGSISIGVAAKVPLPTIYLGMTRVLPVGEAVAGTVSSTVVTSMDPDDRKMIADFLSGVVSGSNADPSSVTATRVKGTSKLSAQPSYTYDARCVSLGQDSLGSIANALASFQKLQREWPDYPGGLLIIDELDAGFHPHAISKLVNQLRAACDRLNLQIVATTHSTKLIEAVYPTSSKPLDAVIYIQDTVRPHLLAPSSLSTVLSDMDLLPEKDAPLSPKLKIYLEDEEAAYVFNTLVSGFKRRAMGKRHGVRIRVVPLGVGCNSLADFTRRDPDFKTTIIALDADFRANAKNTKKASAPNVVHLPSSAGKSPEQELFAFITEALNDPDQFEDRLERLGELGATGDRLREAMLEGWTGDMTKRKPAKAWWRARRDYIHRWKLYELWAEEHQAEMAVFMTELEAAVKAVAKQIRRLAKSVEKG